MNHQSTARAVIITALKALALHEGCTLDWSKLDQQDIYKMLKKAHEMHHLEGKTREAIEAATVKAIWAVFEKCRRPNLHLVS